jgi:hypothetical protein
MPEYMSRFHKDNNPDCTCWDNPKLMLVVIINPECILHGQLARETMEKVAGFTDQELITSAREDAFTGLIKTVSLKQNNELRDKLKPHFEAIMQTIDSWSFKQDA